jgi:UDP-N-acetylglucosamine 1-carboxyvinyltransferase
MEKYRISGGHPLSGEIKVAGAKNAALKIVAASILLNGICKISNIPEIEDIKRLAEILKSLGAKISWKNGIMEINPDAINNSNPDQELVQKLRSSIMLAGPLLARFGEVTMSHPGGCIIGKRPVDMFLSGFEAMGAEIFDHQESFTLRAKKLRGTKIILPKMSVTVTESLMMTACLAEGTTTIINAAMEPEIPSLANYLNTCGAKISGAGTSQITIEGVDKLMAKDHKLIPDRIEAGSFIMMGLATNSEIKVTDCNPNHLETVLEILKNAGANLEIGENHIKTKISNMRGENLQTHEYPGFPTDLQAPFTVLMTQASGRSLIHETIFDGRLFYTDKLNTMGADIIMCDPHRVIVSGKTKLYGKKLESPDLRAGMGLVIAGLLAEGETVIDNIYQIERGYEDLVGRLKNLEAKIEKI